MSILVMKFGGASVSRIKSFSKIVAIIQEKNKKYKKIIVVISAMGKTTDKLLILAKRINNNPPKREKDMLLSIGERISMSLLAMALQKKNIKSISFTGSQSGIITCCNHCNAKIIDIKPIRILRALENNEIVIVAGFQGVSLEKEITTLGRGGSDTSAVALAVALGAKKVEFYKDVDGIYDKDPKKNANATFFNELSYKKALDVVEKNDHAVLNPRCIKLASKNNIKLIIKNFKKFQNLKKFTIIRKRSFKKVKKSVYEIRKD